MLGVVILWAGLVVSAASDESVSGFLGGDVVLPCLLDAYAELSMLEWVRPDLGDDGYLLFYREHRLYPQNQHRRFSRRVHLLRPDPEDGDVSVTLSNLTLEDSGSYSCRVRTTDRRSISSSVHLEVTRAPRTGRLLSDRQSADLAPKLSAVRAAPEQTAGPGADRRYVAAWTSGALFVALSVAVASVALHKRLKLGPTERSQTLDTL